jgi:hypothetical protein
VSAAPARERRSPLGANRGLFSNVRVYRTADAIEFDTLEGYDVVRRSVLLDEVLLVTYHRAFGWPLFVGSALAVPVLGLISAVIAIDEPRVAAGFFAVCGLPLVVVAALRLALRLDVVTVYGVRSKVSLSFWFRKRRARDVFSLVCRLARERQRQRPAPRRAPASVPPAPPLHDPSTAWPTAAPTLAHAAAPNAGPPATRAAAETPTTSRQ